MDQAHGGCEGQWHQLCSIDSERVSYGTIQALCCALLGPVFQASDVHFRSSGEITGGRNASIAFP